MYGILFIVNAFILVNLGSSEEVVKTCESEDEPTIFLAVRVRRVVRFRVITLTTTTTTTASRQRRWHYTSPKSGIHKSTRLSEIKDKCTYDAFGE